MPALFYECCFVFVYLCFDKSYCIVERIAKRRRSQTGMIASYCGTY